MFIDTLMYIFLYLHIYLRTDKHIDFVVKVAAIFAQTCARMPKGGGKGWAFKPQKEQLKHQLRSMGVTTDLSTYSLKRLQDRVTQMTKASSSSGCAETQVTRMTEGSSSSSRAETHLTRMTESSSSSSRAHFGAKLLKNSMAKRLSKDLVYRKALDRRKRSERRRVRRLLVAIAQELRVIDNQKRIKEDEDNGAIDGKPSAATRLARLHQRVKAKENS